MIPAINKLNSRCCGCMAFVNVCPVHALDIKVNKGYLVPVVDQEACTKCGLCSDCCPVINAYILKSDSRPLTVILAKNKNIEERKRSTSGGIFYPIAASIINGGRGTVYGAAFSQTWKVVHSAAADINECFKFQGSKYVQSDIGQCFNDIRDRLKQGNNVLFTGTPCQVAAINSFCKLERVDIAKLITVEILCYGVPSPQIWKDYISYLEKKYGTLLKYCFRDERNGWSTSYNHSATFEVGTELYQTVELQAFGFLFSSHVNIRESCFNCEFSSMHRCADITIGDCWGIEYINRDFADTNGVSQVMINTETGMTIWNKVSEHFDVVDADIDKIAKYNSVLLHPAEKPAEYNAFWNDYLRFGFDKVIKKYTRLGKMFRVRRKIKRAVGRIMKRER